MCFLIFYFNINNFINLNFQVTSSKLIISVPGNLIRHPLSGASCSRTWWQDLPYHFLGGPTQRCINMASTYLR